MPDALLSCPLPPSLFPLKFEAAAAAKCNAAGVLHLSSGIVRRQTFFCFVFLGWLLMFLERRRRPQGKCKISKIWFRISRQIPFPCGMQKWCTVSLLDTPPPWLPLPPARMSAIVRLRPKRAHLSHLHTNAPLRSNWLGLIPSDGSPVVDQSFDPPKLKMSDDGNGHG